MQFKVSLLSLLVLGTTSLANPIEFRDVASPVEERCVNPVCTPGVPCPEYRCAPTIIITPTPTPTPTPTTIVGCHNPTCTPGVPCPLYICATPTVTRVCHQPICLAGEVCPDYCVDK
ncbi:hypothetical protein NA56DRAFT_132544 [Hyaloscypha hepaticicola]|uniref:Uncharacterized protein n=1 Tax=Hyaloscypha hepaticicola TaxID=2082293 RepID=A0A2J6Q496_9HELO|nr:hypothetical protein NA56DRAFT_132544 [Hyaloscypha hepaticicola]